jgi:2-methylisocitrate lyase-like PEP mutase family enzyme
MDTASELSRKAETLRALHQPGRPLVLVNAWDAATARIAQRAGSKAVATTSAGIAFASGFPDGQRISRARMLEAVSAICAAVDVPVTADVEAGYGDEPADAARTAELVVDAGAVGMNLEDGSARPEAPLVEVERQAAKIRAVLAAGASRGVRIVINARTDVYLDRVGPEAERLDLAVHRGRAYYDAGADCVFMPGVTDRTVIAALVERLACPVNVLAVAGSPSLAELARLAVARVSLGSGPMRAAMTLFERAAREALTAGTWTSLDGITSHAAMNDLMSGARRE